ncbi:MAG: helix-turn-helix domain-containing protein [Bacteroidota bacterium]
MILDKAVKEVKDLCLMDVEVLAFAVKAPVLLTEPEKLHQELIYILYNEFKVTWPDIIGKSRKRPKSDARHVYCFIAMTVLNIDCLSIAKNLKRHHSTVLNGRDKIKGFIHVKDELGIKALHIEQLLKSAIDNAKTAKQQI